MARNSRITNVQGKEFPFIFWFCQKIAFDEFIPMPWSDVLPNLSEDGIDLLNKMLQPNPKQRITAAEALKHKYFDDIPQVLRKLYKNLKKWE